MNLEYAIATPDDIPNIVELKIKMFTEFGYEQYLAEDASTLITNDYLKLYEQNLAIHFLVRINNTIAGMVGAFIKSDLPYRYFCSGQYGFIGDVYTEPAYRGQGISTKLNRRALDWLKNYGVSDVRLLASDAGRPLYERLGFSQDAGMCLSLDKLP